MSSVVAQPEASVIERPAFSVVIKVLTTILVVALLFWTWRVADEIVDAAWTAGTVGFMLAAYAGILLCYYWILKSRIRIDAKSIRQTWLWSREVEIADITQIKLIYVPYLSWLIAPRLVLKVRSRGVFVFHASHPEVLQAFARLSLGI